MEMTRPVSDPVCGRTLTQATAKAPLDDAEGSVSFHPRFAAPYLHGRTAVAFAPTLACPQRHRGDPRFAPPLLRCRPARWVAQEWAVPAGCFPSEAGSAAIPGASPTTPQITRCRSAAAVAMTNRPRRSHGDGDQHDIRTRPSREGRSTPTTNRRATGACGSSRRCARDLPSASAPEFGQLSSALAVVSRRQPFDRAGGESA